MKIKCFLWSALQNCLKTWNNLVKNYWYGPSLCTLCKKDSESIEHLSINYRFTIEIWKKACLALKISEVWEGGNFDHCVFQWYKNCKIFHTLPARISWKIWKVRNVSIFEDQLQDTDSIFLQFTKLEREFSSRSDAITKPRILKDIEFNGVVGLL